MTETTALGPVDELLLACATWENLVEQLDGTGLAAELGQLRRAELGKVVDALSKVLGATQQVAELVADEVEQFNAQPQEMAEAISALEGAGMCLYEVHRELDPPAGPRTRYCLRAAGAASNVPGRLLHETTRGTRLYERDSAK